MTIKMPAVRILLCCFALCGGARCVRDVAPERVSGISFVVPDVGQGLAQFAVRDSRAVVWDLGPQDSYPAFKRALSAAGNPYITAISISHNHEDHAGGLAVLDESTPFSGMVIVTPGIDTTALRSALVESWRSRIFFRMVNAGDTLALLDSVLIEVLWPDSQEQSPAGPVDDSANHFSSVFHVVYGGTSVLITSDIDTSAEELLSTRWKDALRSDLMVVPHHGSAGSVDPDFFGYVNPRCALISCAAVNSYGHPSALLLNLLFQMNVPTRATYREGDLVFRSNGYYWQDK